MMEEKPKRKYTRRKKEVAIVETKEATDIDYMRYCGSNGFHFLKKFKNLEKNGLEFNFCSAFLGIPYLMYRKMYLLSLLVILLTAILPSNLITTIGIALMLGFGTDYAYYKKAKYCIERIKSDESLSKEMKEESIRQMGGVDSVSPIVCIGIIMFFTLMFFSFLNLAILVG